MFWRGISGIWLGHKRNSLLETWTQAEILAVKASSHCKGMGPGLVQWMALVQ